MMKMLRNFFVGLGVLTLAATAALGQTQDQRIWGGTSTGSSNAYAVTIANYDAYRAGTCIFFLPNFSNTSAATLNIDSLGVKNIFKPTASGAVALTGGEIVASPTPQVVKVCYDGTQFQIISNTNASALQVFTYPQGYLTPCQVSSGSPVTGCTAGQVYQTGDVTAATAIYYEPAVGNQIPIWNGSNMVQTTFAELAITIPSSRLANTIYDVYVFSNSGVVTGCIGVAWTTSTAGSGARGSGAGTAQIAYQNGIYTNAVSLSCVNGASTFTVPANQGTLVGTILIDGTNGQITNTLTWGQSRKWSVSNVYNTQPYTLQVGDSTASWTYTSGTIRPSNGAAANKATLVLALANQEPRIKFIQVDQISSSNLTIGVGFNSTTAYSGTQGTLGSPTAQVEAMNVASYTPQPFIGQAVVTSLENSNSGSSSQFLGTQANMLLTVDFRN